MTAPAILDRYAAFARLLTGRPAPRLRIYLVTDPEAQYTVNTLLPTGTDDATHPKRDDADPIPPSGDYPGRIGRDRYALDGNDRDCP